MKIRYDFVSNSSSTSFVIIGDAFEISDLRNSAFAVKDEDDDLDYEYDVVCKLEKYGLKVSRGIDTFYDMYVVGLEYYDMKDNETKAEFHDRIKKMLEYAFPDKKDIEVQLCEDAGYDG